MRMRKKKHSAERIGQCSHFQIADPLSFYGKTENCFDKERPMLLEIGCGKGDFAAGLSDKYKDKNIIAIEKIPDVAMFALEKAAALKGDNPGSDPEVPDNLRFIIGGAEYLSDWFAPASFECIYLNFSDPWPKKGYYKRRLTAPSFLEAYRKLLVPDGELHFKTDNTDLFDWSVEQFRSAGLELLFYTRDLHSSELKDDNILTEYERKFSSQGLPIYSAHVRFPAGMPPVPQPVRHRDDTDADGSEN
ncbi:MAG: tRNA (guanosine(46)-N7)-methyltransferase TrmB [Clostridia bacterium]|nr:tRNA (guanosine(46)-N7)-methyltransferase TrmB [Clostridia bacterium]